MLFFKGNVNRKSCVRRNKAYKKEHGTHMRSRHTQKKKYIRKKKHIHIAYTRSIDKQEAYTQRIYIHTRNKTRRPNSYTLASSELNSLGEKLNIDFNMFLFNYYSFIFIHKSTRILRTKSLTAPPISPVKARSYLNFPRE